MSLHSFVRGLASYMPTPSKLFATPNHKARRQHSNDADSEINNGDDPMDISVTPMALTHTAARQSTTRPAIPRFIERKFVAPLIIDEPSSSASEKENAVNGRSRSNGSSGHETKKPFRIVADIAPSPSPSPSPSPTPSRRTDEIKSDQSPTAPSTNYLHISQPVRKRKRNSAEMVDVDDDFDSESDEEAVSMKKLRLHEREGRRSTAQSRASSILSKFASLGLPINGDSHSEVQQQWNRLNLHSEAESNAQPPLPPPPSSAEPGTSAFMRAQATPITTHSSSTPLRGADKLKVARAAAQLEARRKQQECKSAERFAASNLNGGSRTGVKQATRNTKPEPVKPVRVRGKFSAPVSIPVDNSSDESPSSPSPSPLPSPSPSPPPVVDTKHRRERSRVTTEAQQQQEKLANERHEKHRSKQASQREAAIRELRTNQRKLRQDEERASEQKAQAEREQLEREQAERQVAHESRLRAEAAKIEAKLRAEEQIRQELALRAREKEQSSRPATSPTASDSMPIRTRRSQELRRSSRLAATKESESKESDSLAKRLQERKAETDAREQAARSELEQSELIKPQIEVTVARRARGKSLVGLVQEFAPHLLPSDTASARTVRSAAEVKKFLRRCLAIYHPDKAVGLALRQRIENAEIFGVIQRAYEQANSTC